MAQQTSELWKKLWRMNNTRREYSFDINGVEYGPEQEVSHSVTNELYSDFGIGNATCSKLTISFLADNVPRGATIKRYVRLVNDDLVSEWIPAGVYFTSKRSEDDGYWTVEAFDVMRKADTPWNPDQDLNFPMPMTQAVDIFISLMGCELDPRTVLNPAYTIDYPASDPDSKEAVDNNYTIRQELQWIAAAHGGNWIITAEGKLLLVPIGSEPEDTNFLVDEHGDALVLGGVRILIG